MNPSSASIPRWKLPSSAQPVVFAFYMAAIMALLMCSVIVGVSTGLTPQWPARVLHAYALAMPVAFGCVLVVRPLVLRLVHWTVHQG